MMKLKSFDLIKLKPVDEFIKYRKLIRTINQLIADWIKKAGGGESKKTGSETTSFTGN